MAASQKSANRSTNSGQAVTVQVLSTSHTSQSPVVSDKVTYLCVKLYESFFCTTAAALFRLQS